MEYIKKLKNGDTIGIFSPSSPITYSCPKRFERAKKYLKDKGFNILEGNLTGKHELFDDLKTGRKPYEILLEILGDKMLPFIANFDCCHTHPMLTLPIGCEIELSATEKKVTIIEDII